MPGADRNFIRQITVFLDDDDVHYGISFIYQIHRVRADTTAIAVLEQGDRALV